MRNRTLLSELGFNDIDKKLSRHDVACHYMCELSTLIKLSKMEIYSNDNQGSFYLEDGGEKYLTHQEKEIVKEYKKNNNLPSLVDLKDLTSHIYTEVEKPLSKGVGQYKKTIGFLDVEVGLKVSKKSKVFKILDIEGRNFWVKWNKQLVANTVIEVKINKVSIGDIIRQMKLYREFYPNYAEWILVTDYSISDKEKELLKSEGIHHLKLSSDFEEYLKDYGKETKQNIEI